MPAWAKAVFRIVVMLNAALALIGFYWLQSSVRGVLLKVRPSPETPYFRTAFVVMIVLNAVFLMLFLLGAFQLLRLRKGGVIVHAITSALLIAYGFLNGMLWLANPIGRSIAAATGVGNMGIAPFIFLFVLPYLPYVYPTASTMALLLTLLVGTFRYSRQSWN
jgi:hypothetical protein